jgi:hypothetical protein
MSLCDVSILILSIYPFRSFFSRSLPIQRQNLAIPVISRSLASGTTFAQHSYQAPKRSGRRQVLLLHRCECRWIGRMRYGEFQQRSIHQLCAPRYRPLTPDQEGWISRFHSSLEAFLSMRLGHTAKVWRDDKLRGNDVFADEIVCQFEQTAILVSILTPRYLNSDWCTREAREFCERAVHSGEMVVDNRARTFKILKSPIDSQESLPAPLRNTMGYEFFTSQRQAMLSLVHDRAGNIINRCARYSGICRPGIPQS